MTNLSVVKLISICISTYEMHGMGHIFLKYNFDIFTKQTFKDFDVVISDNSMDTKIQALCEEYKDILTIHYYKNNDPLKGMSSNINNAIQNATGKIIKILFLDDFLYDEKSLQEIAESFDINKDHWMVTGCEHTKDGKSFTRPFYPKYNSYIHLGKNTIGSPSVLAIKNDQPLLFDVNLKWLMDCDYYKRCYLAFGKPKILNRIITVIRTGEHQVSNTEATQQLRYTEYKYVLRKYEKNIIYLLLKIFSLVKYQLNKIIYVKN